jgi:VanZ like family
LRARDRIDTGMTHKFIAFSAWTTLVFIAFATLSPIGLRPGVSSDPDIERFGAYFVGGMLLALAYPRRPILVACLIAAIATMLEGSQFLTPDRHGQVSDGLVKIAGGMAGVSLTALILHFGRNARFGDGQR